MKNKLAIFTSGLIKQNPVFVMMLGMCPALATTISVYNAIGMGLSVTFVLTCSNAAISLTKRFIPDKVRLASYIVIIAGFVTLMQMLLQAYVPELYGALGIFIPLIVVNCIVLARAEAFASKNGVFSSILDGIGIGLGFTLALMLIASIREILGSGTFFGISLFGEGFMGASIMLLPPGGFLILGIVLMVINAIKNKRKAEK